jgi:DNA repair exonuclease SbcCD ATPase subunit
MVAKYNNNPGEDMTDKTENNEQRSDEQAGENNGSGEPTLNAEELKKEVERLKAINKDVIESRDKVKSKLRSFEEQAEKAKEEQLKQQGEFQSLYEKEKEARVALETKMRTHAVNSALKSALEAANAISVDTALALVNKDGIKVNEEGEVVPESLAEAIAKVKEQHAVLFTGVRKGPDPARAGETPPTGGYLEELKKIQSNPKGVNMKDLEALREKYGRR